MAQQPEGRWAKPLRRVHRIAWVRIAAVPLDLFGNDLSGRYHGRTGRCLFILEFPDGNAQFFRADDYQDALKQLKRNYPRAKVETAPHVRMDNPCRDHSKPK